MACTNFPQDGLIPNVTTHLVGEVLYRWSGAVWESTTGPIDASKISWTDKTVQYSLDDNEGFKEALLAEAGITPSGIPDTATASQRLDALKLISKSNSEEDVATHNADPLAHHNLSAFITSEADRAETAADVAVAGASIYSSTVDGLAATSSGEYFSVVSADSDEYLILYLNNSGVAVPQKTYPSKEAVDAILSASNDLFAVDSTNVFPSANLTVRRYTGVGVFNDYAAGYSQTASVDGLDVAIPASGSAAIKHYLRTAVNKTTESVSMSFTLASIPAGGGYVGVGFINGSGVYVSHTISPSGVVYRNEGYTATAITGVIDATIQVGSVLTVAYVSGKVVITHNGVEIYSAVTSDNFDGELLIAQAGFLAYRVKLIEKSDPIRDWTIDYVSSQLPDTSTFVTKTSLEAQASDLFSTNEIEKFPDANLVARRYTATATFNDYAEGYSQTTGVDGLNIAVPASGSSGIKHYFKTGLFQDGTEYTASIKVTTTTAFYAVGFGFINGSGEYIGYFYSGTGVARRSNGFNDVALSGIIQPLNVNDIVKIKYTNGSVVYIINDIEVARYAVTDDFVGEMLISQSGFPAYTVSFDNSTDPIGIYVNNEISSNVNIVVDFKTENSLTVYVKGVNDYWVSYPLIKVVNAGIKYDCWSFFNSDEFILTEGVLVSTGRFPSKIVAEGVNESPWKEYPAATDFISGTAHGDELVQGITLEIDGKLYDTLKSTGQVAAKSARFIVDSIVYSNLIADKPIIRRKRVYDFGRYGMKIDNQNSFLADSSFTIMYHNAVTHAGVFTSYYIDKELDVTAVSGVERKVNGDFREYTMIGSKASARVSINSISNDGVAISPSFLLAASGKPYFDLVNGGAGLVAVTTGQFIRIKSEYCINTF